MTFRFRASTLLVPFAFLPAALTTTTARAADAPEARCIFVLGQGRNVSSTDARANDQWNRINTIFNTAVEGALVASQRPVVTFVVPVEGQDADKNFQVIVKLAGAERCDTVVDTSMYADQERHLLVSHVGVHEVVASARPIPQPPVLSIGRLLMNKERTDPLTQETLDKLSPNDVARELTAPWLASLKH
jgi:hypothetical protein